MVRKLQIQMLYEALNSTLKQITGIDNVSSVKTMATYITTTANELKEIRALTHTKKEQIKKTFKEIEERLKISSLS